MECEKTPMLRHLAVHGPDVLSTDAWRTHVSECGTCYAEWRAFATSLVLYQHVEREDTARRSFRPSWEAYRRRLEEQRLERRRMSVVTGTWLAGMVGLVLFGGAMSWGLWNDSGSLAGTALVLDEDALSIGYREEGRAGRRAPLVVRGQVPAPGGSYGPMGAEARLLRRWRLLEQHMTPSGRPSGEVAILPFSHEGGATPYVMPSTSAPGQGIRLTFTSAPASQSGYVLSSPVH